MTAAQAAEIGAVGDAARRVGEDVVEVGPDRPVAAAGVATGAVARHTEAPLGGRRPVAVDRGRPVEDRALAAAGRVDGAALPGQPLQLSPGRGGAEGAGGRIDDGDVEAAAGGATAARRGTARRGPPAAHVPPPR